MVFTEKIKKSGFTLIEILVAMSIMMIILAISISMSKSLNDSVELENASKNVDLKIRAAKARSIGALADSNYGVHLDMPLNEVVIFDATGAYVEGAAGNEVFALPDKIEIYDIALNGGGSNLVFDRLTGSTVNFGSIGLRVIGDTSKTRTIFINSNGQSSLSAFGTSTGPMLTNARHVHFDLGWDIQSATQLKLAWVDDLDNPIGAPVVVATADYFNADKSKFDWEGQNIQIHSWLDADGHTVLCVIRDQTETEKLHIYFDDGAEKRIATYDRNGAFVDVTPDATYGGDMDIQ